MNMVATHIGTPFILHKNADVVEFMFCRVGSKSIVRSDDDVGKPCKNTGKPQPQSQAVGREISEE